MRYPLTDGSSFGGRCPHCLGETRVVLSKQIVRDENLKEDGRKPALPKKHTALAVRRKCRDNASRVDENKELKRVLLDNIRSAWNVGSILRSADGFGFSHAYLCGITPTPEMDAVRKTALGADEYVTWSHHRDAVKLVTGLKKEGWSIWALEEDERAIALSECRHMTAEKVVLIVGNEVTGVDPELLELADNIFYIPMRGRKRSFNVAVAFGVVGYSLSA